MKEDDLDRCYKIMAKVVKKHGDDFLPIFERLHKEIQAREERNKLRNIALKVADENEKISD